MAFTGERFEIVAGRYRAEVAEVGAALAGLWHDDAPVTVELPTDGLAPKSAGAVLLPWPNRIRDGRYTFDAHPYQLPLTEPASHNASHGLVKWVRWSLIEHDEAAACCQLDLVPQTGYPFELRLRVRYLLDAETGLSVYTTALNTGSAAAPFGAGFHPYLDLGEHELDTAQLLIPAATVLRTDDQQIPVGGASVAETAYDFRQLRVIGTQRLDDGFADLTGDRAVLRTEQRTVQLRWDESFHCLQVFTPPFITPGRNAVAIEPMSCPANAFNSGEHLIRLEPGVSWSGSWGIAVAG